MMVPFGGIGHFILLISCLAAVLQQRTETQAWLRFVAGGVVALAYLVVIVAIARPR
jgi:intracellular septation protein A